MNTIKIFLTLAVNLGWDLQKFEIKNAFLDEDLEEEIIKAPPRYEEVFGKKV